jgi:ankyrin repeat protein
MYTKTDHPLHYLLDVDYHPNRMIGLLEAGVDPNAKYGPFTETALHAAVRRRRLEAIQPLLKYGADINAQTKGGKTAYAHATRRGFFEISQFLEQRGADTGLNQADELAVALIRNDLSAARAIITANPDLVPGMTHEEARILPDLAGRPLPKAMILLLDAGVDIAARGLDGGTALHQAAWFGQPEMVEILIHRNAPLEVLCREHQSTPLGWAAHGSSFSGGAQERADAYVKIAALLLEAGAPLVHPHDPNPEVVGGWLLDQCSPEVAAVIRRHI